MAEAVISAILTQVGTIMEQMVREEIKLVTGAKEDVKKLSSTFKSILAVLVDAEKRRVEDEHIKNWLENLKDVAYDADDVLSEWITSMQKSRTDQDSEASSSSIFKKVFTLPFSGVKRVSLRRDIALKIQEINGRLDNIATEKERYNFNLLEGSGGGVVRLKMAAYVDLLDVKGRDGEKDELIQKMRHHENSLRALSIVGFGGIGKTTLAQFVYNSVDVISHFDLRMWVCVSEPFDEVRVAKAIVEDAEGSAPNAFELETVLRHLRRNIQGKKYLLVLDDVWTKDYRKWEQIFNSLKTGAPGSTVLVTTRSEEVAKIIGSSYELGLGKLQDEDSWSLFRKIAFCERSTEECQVLECVGKKIAKKCQGLPLAIKTIGSLMRFMPALKDWQDVLDSEFWKIKEVEDYFFAPLMLSYYDLPMPMKRCFSFCAFFPKDHVIEADNLIKLWMSQGYLNSTENEELMEITGQKYLQNLAMRSFFQDLVKHKDGQRILTFKMHDMVHDFALYLNKNEFSLMEVSNSDLVRKMELPGKQARHVVLVRTDDLRFPANIQNVQKLHSFWVQCFYDCPRILSGLHKIESDLFSRMERMKALDLSRNRLGELPKVGKMMSLKYLNLSHNPLRELPENLCDLYNLQSLNLTGCDHLQKLPQMVGKLVNLRHLEIDGTGSLKSLPKGVSRLISLQTLSKFVISQGVDGEESTFKIEDLKNLNNLGGRLTIQGLSYATDADKARRSEMQKKNRLEDLHLDFNSTTQSSGGEDSVIEALQLHENLKILQISSFRGTKLPSWLINLTSLTELFLIDCRNCTTLPPLGQLSSLVTLYIDGMVSIEFIGPAFLGVHAIGNRMTNNIGGSERIAFPKLKKLKISNMDSLKEWNVVSYSNRGSGDENAKIMPFLKCLKLTRCSKLNSLPEPLLFHARLLSKLSINECTLLQQYFKKTGENWSKISHISKVRIS